MKKDYTIFSEEMRTKKHDEICDRIKNTYAAKHHDYGPSFEKSYYDFGWVAAYVRMEDKMSRLRSLFEKGENNRKVMDEKIADTVIDLANYAIMLATELEMENEQSSKLAVGNINNYNNINDYINCTGTIDDNY